MITVLILNVKLLYMGNTITTQDKSRESLSRLVDKIATSYILTPNFNDLKNLTNEKYCNNLVILTSQIISKNISSKEINYLKQRMKSGQVINEMNKDSVLFVNKDKLSSSDVMSKTEKKRMCIGIARFYVKIAHLFAAITTTIRPTFEPPRKTTDVKFSSTQLDRSGFGRYDMERPLLRDMSYRGGKVEIEKKDMVLPSKQTSLCSKRVNDLQVKRRKDFKRGVETLVQPAFCTNPSNVKLSDEAGIPELEKLYFDDYNFETGQFRGMKDKTKTQYLKDVELFYKVFTGKDKMPKNIKKFSHIRLKDYRKHPICKTNKINSKIKFSGSVQQEMVAKYAEHIANMSRKMESKEKLLINVLNKLFSRYIDPLTQQRSIIISPKLNDKGLQELIEETRKTIIELYSNCESDFKEGVEIYENLIELNMKNSLQEEINILSREKEEAGLGKSKNRDDIAKQLGL